jgi:hypothetical protein
LLAIQLAKSVQTIFDLTWRFAVKQAGSPRALNRITQSRMICSVTPPILAASVRVTVHLTSEVRP